MAILTSSVVVCDKCKNPKRKTTRWRLGDGDGALYQFLLCREHAQPLQEMLALGGEQITDKPKARLWTMDEINAMKH